jgi:HEAT repeat protein
MSDQHTIDDHIADLSSDSAFVRARAAARLYNTRDPRAIEPLIALLADEDVSVRKNAVIALGQSTNELTSLAVPHLIPLLDDSVTGIQWLTAQALGLIGDDRAVEPLLRVLGENRADYLCGVCVRALGHIGDGRALRPLLLLQRRLFEANAQALKQGKILHAYLHLPSAIERIENCEKMRQSEANHD